MKYLYYGAVLMADDATRIVGTHTRCGMYATEDEAVGEFTKYVLALPKYQGYRLLKVAAFRVPDEHVRAAAAELGSNNSVPPPTSTTAVR